MALLLLVLNPSSIIIAISCVQACSQLEAPRGVHIARNLDFPFSSIRRDIGGHLGIEGRPVDKVDKVDTELRGVSVDKGPLDVDSVALQDGRVGHGSFKLDSRNKRGREGEERQSTHFDLLTLISLVMFDVKEQRGVSCVRGANRRRIGKE